MSRINNNYLLGRAERLVRRIEPPPMKPQKAHPYTLGAAIDRVVPKLERVAQELADVPALACPGDEAVALLTLHPTYLAKSYFPDNLLSAAHLRPIGSRKRTVSPDAWAVRNHPEEAVTTELFVAGKRKDFENLPRLIEGTTDPSRWALDLRKVEDFRPYPLEERVKPQTVEADAPYWEVVLHASALPESDYILDGFRRYLASLGARLKLDDRLHVQGLCFVPVRIPESLVEEVAQFSFLRVARGMPHVRPVIRMSKASPTFSVTLPDMDVMDPSIRVAVFDGGMPATPDLSRWSNRRKAKGVGAPVPELVDHGLGVASALLFGPLEDGVALPQPYAKVDHFRVVDQATEEDDNCEYFDVIKRIMTILESGNYEFVNCSIGPDLPIDDDNPHVRTSMLDQFLKKGTTLASTAVGNTGDKDHSSGNARIQSPSDRANALGVGSADCLGPGWRRSSHSSIGPGRSPGIVKPDVLAFGGCPREPFYVIGPTGVAEGRLGTSFASPTALRAAIGARAHLGPVVSPLALKALLVHRCDPSPHPQAEAGWGKVAEHVRDLVVCEDATAHIVYQGTIEPGSWMRAEIPMPEDALKGRAELRATFCFASDTDPEDPFHYTRSGLEVRFRPHDGKKSREKKGEKQREADTKPFSNAGEAELRTDAHKWETTLHARKKFLGRSLHNPYFDIHYNAREGGGKAGSPQDITYALIVSIHSPRTKDLYDRIVRRYRTILEALRPVVEVPIRR